MKFRYIALLLAIILSAAAVGYSGYQLKQDIIIPLQLEDYMDVSVFELPFLAKTDEELLFYVEFADELLAELTEPSEPERPNDPTVESTVQTDPTTQPTVKPTQPSQTQPTDPDVVPTEPSKEPTETTQKPTEPSTSETTKPKPTQPKPPAEEPTLDFPEGRVDDSWFENTLFIGDSRMLGLSLYARSGNAHYFCAASLNCSSVFKQTLSDKGNFSNKTLEELLSEHQYDKIIINFGLNDAGYGEAWFQKRFDQFMEKIRTWNPDAKIIINGIMPVTKKYIETAKYGGPYWEPESLRKLSAHMASYANGIDVFYIDCNEYFADSNGYLFQSLTGDGCHPTATHYKTWREWMSWALSTLGI